MGRARAPRAGFVAVGDIDGDGKPDVVTSSGSATGLSVLRGNGNGAFQAARHAPTAGQWLPRC